MLQVAQGGWDRPRQIVPGEVQLGDSVGGVGRHPVPLAQRRRRLPVPAVRPALAPGRVVEHLEHLAVVPGPGRGVDGHRDGLGGAQAAGVGRRHGDRRRPRRPRHEPDGIAGCDSRDHAGLTGRGRVDQRILVGVGEVGVHGHADRRTRLGQRLRRDGIDGLGRAVARVSAEVDRLQPRLKLGSGGRTRPRVRDVQRSELRQPGQALGKASRQGIGPEGQPLQVRQVPQLGRDRPRQRVPAEGQPLQVRQVPQLGRDRPRQVVRAEVQRPEAGQAPQLGRDRPRQRVPAEGQSLQVRQVPQLGRNRPRQVVPAEGQPLQVRQVPQLGRDRPRQRVTREGQPREVRQVPQLGRNRPRQLVPAEVQ